MDQDRRPTWRAAATGYGAAAVLTPILALADASPTSEKVRTAIAVLVAVVVAWLFVRFPAGRRWALLGPVLVAVAGVLYVVTPAGLATVIIAPLVGAGVGLAVAPGCRAVGSEPAVASVALVAGAATVALTRLLVGSDGRAVAVGAVLAVVAAMAAVVAPRDASAEASDGVRAGRVLAGAAVGVALVLVAWTGANDPQLSWFGPVVANGDRSERTVALTFDDGPNDPATLEIASILEDHDTRGTFFVVGAAVDAEPEAVAELADRGHLIGNHSFHHDSWRWLDPRYPELERTQAAVEAATGLCPRYYRPPHGQRTPFVSWQVARAGMEMVLWDTSGADWRTGDPQALAERILRRVRPGSIVLLHDGLNGVVDADRSVVVEALPLILDGLEERGLTPVRLDDMIGGPAYLEDC